MKQVIVMRKDLDMRSGKIAVQAAHAATMWLFMGIEGTEQIARRWAEESALMKVCVRVNSEAELLEVAEKARAAGLIVVPIRDAGRTAFHGVPTMTCCAIGPADDDAVDAITGALKLF